MRIPLLFLLILLNSSLVRNLLGTDVHSPGERPWESEAFCRLSLGETVAAWEEMDCELLASLLLEYDFQLEGVRLPKSPPVRLVPARGAAFQRLSDACHLLFDDLAYFPVPEEERTGEPRLVIKDGWEKEKNCRIRLKNSDVSDISGGYPVVSMTRGVVEESLLLPGGGRRLRIRSPKGALFSYEPLFTEEERWQSGEFVRAGEILGRLSGDGLWLQISIRTENYANLFVNPYWILKYLEKHRLSSRILL